MSISRVGRAVRSIVMASMLVLILTASASASQGPDKVRLTSEGQAAAKAVVLTEADFSFATGWTGGSVKVDPASNSRCDAPGSKPLATVTNGDQKAEFNHTAAKVTSEITILKTSAMVRGTWTQGVGPQLITCLRAALSKSIQPNERIISVKARAFPHVATYTQAYRVLTAVTVDGTTVTIASDFILFARGRTEAFMTTVAPVSQLLNAFEAHLARVMATRITV